jgi:hypothetical protein
LSADDVRALLAALSADEQPQDAEQLGQLLIRRQKLTAY